jgi:hypothetical protein
MGDMRNNNIVRFKSLSIKWVILAVETIAVGLQHIWPVFK